jgi:lipopolysaccharide transport system ATP-binding protein
MSSDKIITVHNLGKKYSLRHQRNEPYTTLRDVLTDRARNLFDGTEIGHPLLKIFGH